MSPDEDPIVASRVVEPGGGPEPEVGDAAPVGATDVAEAMPAEAPAEAAAARSAAGYAVRVRGEDSASRSELFAEVEAAHARFGDLAAEHPTARVSLYGPGGSLIRRRPSNADRCGFCGEPARGAWPVTGLGTDTGTRRRDVISLCPEHHAAVTGSEGGMVFGPWRWHPGHSMA